MTHRFTPSCVAAPVAAAIMLSMSPLSAAANERQFAEAAAQYQAGRYSDAYGRFIALAEGGHAESSRIVLFMHRHGALLYGSHWDLDMEQIALYGELSRKPPDAPRTESLALSQGARKPVRFAAQRAQRGTKAAALR